MYGKTSFIDNNFALVSPILGWLKLGIYQSIDIWLHFFMQQFTQRKGELVKLFSEAGITPNFLDNLDVHTFKA